MEGEFDAAGLARPRGGCVWGGRDGDGAGLRGGGGGGGGPPRQAPGIGAAFGAEAGRIDAAIGQHRGSGARPDIGKLEVGRETDGAYRLVISVADDIDTRRLATQRRAEMTEQRDVLWRDRRAGGGEQ